MDPAACATMRAGRSHRASSLEGTVGQHAGGPIATGGAFELSPGFHRRGAMVDGVFAVGFEDD